MKRTLERNIAIGFGAALLLVSVVAVVAFKSIRQFASNNMWEDHTRQVLVTIADLSANTKDAETALRGHVISGDEQYLSPYHVAGVGMATNVRELRDLTSDNPGQQHRLDLLGPVIHERLAVLDRLAVARKQGFEAAQQLMGTGEGRQLMDEVTQLLSQMREEENQLLKTRSIAATASARMTTIVISCGSAMAVVIVLGAGALIRRDLVARRRAEEELDLFFTLSLDLLCIAGTDGYFKRLSPVWEKTLGIPREELLARPYLDLVHPDDRAATVAEGAKLALGVDTIDFENRYMCKDGSYRWLLWTATLVPDRQVLYCAARDVTDRKEAEKAIRLLNDDLEERAVELEAANKELEAFSYSVSHDLRSPLRSIDGFSQALLEDYSGALDDEGKGHLSRVRGATQRMGQLIDDMLKLSRLTRSELRRGMVDISATACEVITELRKADPNRTVEVVVEEGLTAQADPHLVRIALDNLLGNAWKFTSKRPDARIEVGRRLEDGGAAFYVKDNGAGFNMMYVNKLFGAFQRLHSTSDFSGTGVGLATVQRIVNRHGGRVWAQGAPDKGATFSFTL